MGGRTQFVGSKCALLDTPTKLFVNNIINFLGTRRAKCAFAFRVA